MRPLKDTEQLANTVKYKRTFVTVQMWQHDFTFHVYNVLNLLCQRNIKIKYVWKFFFSIFICYASLCALWDNINNTPENYDFHAIYLMSYAINSQWA